ncbi:MAG TPA: PilZ domain-containing protein [Clostridiaceae bacterium]|nr:PilZ domain-containing protein [Clostridiaceae bacterium]
MEKYNLDEKGGLFKFNVKNPSKVVKQGDNIEFKHFNVFDFIKATVVDVTDSTIKIKSNEKLSDVSFSPGDHVILYYRPSKEFYVVTAEISSVDKNDPLEVTLKVHKIERIKDLVKNKKCCVCFPATVKIIGVPEGRFAAVKNISFGGVKVDCKEEIMMEDIVDVTIKTDKTNKLSFKGRVVRKNKLENTNEYGIEFSEMTESCSKLLTRIMYEFESIA